MWHDAGLPMAAPGRVYDLCGLVQNTQGTHTLASHPPLLLPRQLCFKPQFCRYIIYYLFDNMCIIVYAWLACTRAVWVGSPPPWHLVTCQLTLPGPHGATSAYQHRCHQVRRGLKPWPAILQHANRPSPCRDTPLPCVHGHHSALSQKCQQGPATPTGISHAYGTCTNG